MRDDYNKIPSEWPNGKPSHDADYMAGFVAAIRAYKRSKNASMTEGTRLWGQARKRHGAWWLEGFGNGIDFARYQIKHPIAKALGLV